MGQRRAAFVTRLLRQVQADPDLRLYLIVAGMHLSPEFGFTARTIEADGFEINERVGSEELRGRWREAHKQGSFRMLRARERRVVK